MNTILNADILTAANHGTPLVILCVEKFDSWLSEQAASVQNWLKQTGFEGKGISLIPGSDGQLEKAGTPTMGGLIILAAILIPTLLFAKLDNIYTITMLVATVWLGLIGFIDDYIKLMNKDRRGLSAATKFAGQILLGILIGGNINSSLCHDRMIMKNF